MSLKCDNRPCLRIPPNGLEMSRLAAMGNVPSAEASFPGSVPWAKGQLQEKDTPAASLVSISGRWQRDPAGQVGSIELLGGLRSRGSCHMGALGFRTNDHLAPRVFLNEIPDCLRNLGQPVTFIDEGDDFPFFKEVCEDEQVLLV